MDRSDDTAPSPAPVRGALGILAYRHRRQKRMWGEQTSYIVSLLKVGSRLKVPVFAFGPQDVDLARGRVRGWRRREGGWRSKWYRKPQLVYDRFFLRQEPGAGRRLALYRRFKGRGGFQFLNPHLPDKWTVYRMLKDAGHLDEHLPPTVPYRGAGGLIKRLDQWGGVVVKPVRGQKGLGLWFMRPGGGGRIRIRSGTEKSRTVSRRGLAGWCAGKIRRNGHLVQKLLALRDPGRRPRDVRVIVQRDGEGRIGVTGMAVRVGRRGTLLANLHRGGYAARVEEVLEGIRPPKDALLSGVGGDDAGPAGFDAGTGSSAEICLAAVARAVFQVLDDAMGSFAELGIDLGVDAAGCIWFIEANGRPGRSIFREIRAREIRRLSIVHPIAYARRRLLER